MIFRGRIWKSSLAVGLLLSVEVVGASPPADAIAQAELEISRGNGVAAEVILRQAVNSGVPVRDVAALAGEAELLQGNLVAAREWLGPAEFSPATRLRGLRALARLEISQGDPSAASRAYDRALEDGLESAGLWVDIGRLRFRSGQHYLAADAARKAVQIDPQSPEALELRGQIVRDSLGPVPALNWFEKGKREDPDNLSLAGELAATLSEAGRNREMLEVARRMVEKDPEDPRGYFLQSVLAARAGNYRLARKLFDRTNGAYSAMPSGRLFGATLELQSGDPKTAADHFEALLDEQPDNELVARLLGSALLESGRAADLIDRLKPAADRPEASPYLLTLVGRAFEQLDSRIEAASYLDRAARLRPATITVLPVQDYQETGSTARAVVPQLRQLLVDGRRGEAENLANRTVARFGGSIDVANLAGDVALLNGQPRSALEYYARAATVRSDFSLIERTIAAQGMLGRDEDARRILAKFVADNPRNGAAIALYARFEVLSGNLRRGKALLELASKLGGGRDPVILADLSEVEAKLREEGKGTARLAYLLQRSGVRTTYAYATASADQDVNGGTRALAAKLSLIAGATLARN